MISSSKSFALYSQAIIICFGIINVILNKTYFSQENLGRYYLLTSVLILKELLTSGVIQNYMIKLSKSEKPNHRLVLINSLTSYLLKKTPYLFILSLFFSYFTIPGVDLKYIFLFALLLSFDFTTMWYFPVLESTGNLHRLYRYRVIVTVLAYISSWLILYLHKSLYSVLIFLLISIVVKFALILNHYKRIIWEFKLTNSIPKSISSLQTKINLTFFSSLVHKATLFPLLRPSLGLEIIGSIGVISSIFSSASSLSREIIRSNLKVYGAMYVEKSSKLLSTFTRDLLTSLLIYILSIIGVGLLIYVSKFAESLYLFWGLFYLSSFYFFGLYVANQNLWFHRLYDKEPLRWQYLALALVTLTLPLFTETSTIFIILSITTIAMACSAVYLSYTIYLKNISKCD